MADSTTPPAAASSLRGETPELTESQREELRRGLEAALSEAHRVGQKMLRQSRQARATTSCFCPCCTVIGADHV
jgi:uncharacterized membrane protein